MPSADTLGLGDHEPKSTCHSISSERGQAEHRGVLEGRQLLKEMVLPPWREGLASPVRTTLEAGDPTPWAGQAPHPAPSRAEVNN